MSWFGMKKAEFKPGFRDVRWGDVPSAGMSVLRKDGEETVYMRANDSLRIGEGRLTGINYQFWRGKLQGVIVEIAPGSVRVVMQAVQQVYGKPTQPNPLKPKYYWMSIGAGDEATQAMIDVDTPKQTGTPILFRKMVLHRPQPEEGARSIA